MHFEPADCKCSCCPLAGVAGNIHKHGPAQPGPRSGRLRCFFHAHCHLQDTAVTTHHSLFITDGDSDDFSRGSSFCKNDILMPFRPRYSILGQVTGTDLYLDVDTYKEVRVCE